MSDELDMLAADGFAGAEDVEMADDFSELNNQPVKSVKAEARDSPEFDTIDWSNQAVEDDKAIETMLAGVSGGQGAKLNLEGFGDKKLDQTDKADDAIDYEDISDDDIASEDGGHKDLDTSMSQIPNLTEDSGTSHDQDGFDDLFGDGDDNLIPSSPPTTEPPTQPTQDDERDIKGEPDGEANRSSVPAAPSAAPVDANVTDDDWNNIAWVNEQSNRQDHSAIPIPPQNVDELLEQKFPSFAPHKILYFRELFQEWPAEFSYKEPAKSPPALVPTKLELELEGDSAKLFRLSDSTIAATQKRPQQQYGEENEWSRFMGSIAMDMEEPESDSEDENEPVGGFTLAEFATVCDDWDSIHDPTAVLDRANGLVTPPHNEDEEMDDWDREFLQPDRQQTKKKRKIEIGLPDISSFDTSGINNFAEATKRFGQRVRLDLNDPYLLIEDLQSDRPKKRPKIEEKTTRMANGQLGRDVKARFNISNDDAYNALKANNKSKVRATLGNLAVEHSLPALKLTFPFYRTKLEGNFWEHHRKKFDLEKLVRSAITFKKHSRTKRKELKNRSIQDIFKTSKDLSLNDNSSAVLFEYSEQAPVMLSNFGMGSRVINYHRRKDDKEEDSKTAKADIGEPHILMPEDKSPFSIFGKVEPGETVPTLHNEITNVHDGPRFYLKAIDHIYVVGQTFPSVEVPGPHARKVTSTAKNRLKMISYRMMRKRPTQDVDIHEITPHVFDKFDPQNSFTEQKANKYELTQRRQKMKEFLAYDRDSKTWKLKEGESLMDEKDIRAMIKPEDVCLIEAMQIGQMQLQAAGYDVNRKNATTADDEDEGGAEEPLAIKMAPWKLTSNFLEASAQKAMVALHGEGDPTGHGLGFSFIKTSMKGGYINAVQGPLATSADAIEKERKANGGHSYNVKKQHDMYTAAIGDIWERQKTTLSDPTTHEDADVLDTTNEDDRFNTRKSDYTPAAHVDDGRSQFSRTSAGSRLQTKRKLKINRKVRDEDGNEVMESVILDNPAVIRNYIKLRKETEETSRDVYSLKATGDADADRERMKLVEKELSRLLKNQDRRQVREKQGKGKKKKNAVADPDAASPDPSGSADKTAGGTTRKCANCGQVGHIKTNKSKCPLLNGTITNPDSANDSGGFGSFSAPAAGGSAASP
ncbi:hypothetical protein PG997_009415 [Apiospora hydei]|uniref:Transcription initiation factor TFIID subunit 1 histone acetyltransferase domain-containing protein n=1 Tax=Apiospora hydei TaxID=1337664 RepID=A0ABR1VVA8_9PEZI